MDVNVRKASPADACAIAQVHVDSWRTTYSGIIPQEFLDPLSYEEREQRWRNILSDPLGKEFVLVAETAGGHVIGFACGGPERQGGTVFQGEITAIYLLQSCQRQGIGRRLVAAAAEELLRHGMHSMLVWVLQANPARAFYEARGGCKLYEGEANFSGVRLPDVAYGWEDIKSLAKLDQQKL